MRGLKSRAIIATVVLVMAVMIAEAGTWYCQTWGCREGTLCGSSSQPRQIGTCIFKCEMVGQWVEFWCQLPDGK